MYVCGCWGVEKFNLQLLSLLSPREYLEEEKERKFSIIITLVANKNSYYTTNWGRIEKCSEILRNSSFDQCDPKSIAKNVFLVTYKVSC